MRVRPIGVTTLLVSLSLVLHGCRTSTAPPQAPPSPTTAPAPRPAEPDYRRTSVLLDFESGADAIFVAADGADRPLPDGEYRRSGDSSLKIPKGAAGVTVKFASLVSGREFPGAWTLAGAHLLSTEPVTVSVGLGGRSRQVTLAAGQWTPLLLDITPFRQSPLPDDAMLAVTFVGPLSSDVWLDDVLLADNARTLVDPDQGVSPDAWTVRRDGFTWIVERPNRFRLTLPTEEAAGGWRVDEASRLRTVLRSNDGKTRTLALYHDGRSFWDAKFKPLAMMDGAAEYATQHQRPARLSIPVEQGRLDRNTGGDVDHDGYNESTGSYQLVAAGSRIEITLTPRTDGLLRPVLDIRNLPPGDVRAILEGTLAADVLRLPDGRALVLLPGRIQRPALLDIRVK